MKELDDYFSLQKNIYDYFGYVEDWVVIPLDDQRESYWHLDSDKDGPTDVFYANTEEELSNKEGEYFEASIYFQRFLPKWVYRGTDYTMVCADTHCDGNKFLMVFSNDKER